MLLVKKRMPLRLVTRPRRNKSGEPSKPTRGRDTRDGIVPTLGERKQCPKVLIERLSDSPKALSFSDKIDEIG
jgi:hypothetical protein